jgi:hypothetical protein
MEYAILSLRIEYDKIITTKIEQLDDPVVGCLDYGQFDGKTSTIVYWIGFL